MGFSERKGIVIPGTTGVLEVKLDSNPGTEIDVFSFQVDAAKRRLFLQLKVYSKFPCVWRLVSDEAGTPEHATLHTHPAKQKDVFEWAPWRIFLPNTICTLKARVDSGAPVDQVRAWLDFSEVNN